MLGQGGPDALEQLPGWDDDAREGLDRIVRDCLAPSACLRPAAATVTRRLLLASSFGGTYVDEFEEELRFGIQAGQSLFAVVTDDLDALEAVIVSFARRGFHLYVASPDGGLQDRLHDTVSEPWLGADEIHAVWRSDDPAALPPTPDDVCAVNGEIILGSVVQMRPDEDGRRPVVLIRGNGWWDYGPAARRALKMCQANHPHTPTVIVANNAAAMAFDVDLARWFTGMPFPGPKPAELFKRLLAWPRAEGRDLPDIEPGTAARLAKEFFPASMRDIEMALRMCALKHGRVDERVLDKSVRVVRTNGRTAYSVSAAKRWTALRWTGRAFAEDLADHVALSGSGKLWTVTGKEIRSEVPVVRARRGTLDRAAVVAMTCQAAVQSLVLTPGKQVVVQFAARKQIVLQEGAIAQLVPARQAVGARLASLDFAGYTLDWRWVPGAG